MLPIKSGVRQEKGFGQNAAEADFLFKQPAEQRTEKQQRPETDQLQFDKSGDIPGIQSEQQEKSRQNKEKLNRQPGVGFISQGIAGMGIYNSQRENDS